jgi:hypothetical protein
VSKSEGAEGQDNDKCEAKNKDDRGKDTTKAKPAALMTRTEATGPTTSEV